MRIVIKIFFICFCLLSFQTFANENLFEIRIEDKLQNSNDIIEGKVIEKTSFWNSLNTKILTKNKIEIYSAYKGNIDEDYIYIITEGGVVENKAMTTSSLLDLNVGDFGMFFINKIQNQEEYDVFSSKQGFISYDFKSAIANCPFYIRELDAHKTSIESLIGHQKRTFRTVTSIFTKSLNIINFSPSILQAGTGDILTITGTDFGTSGPSANDFIEFTDGNSGNNGVFIQVPLGDYVSWSDTVIKVRVPSRAATGKIRITAQGNVFESQSDLTVRFSIMNLQTNSVSYMPRIVNNNTIGGNTWKLNSNFSSNVGPVFISAMENWKCLSGINWDIASQNTNVNEAIANDGINVVSFSLDVSAGVLGVNYNYFIACNNGTEWYLNDQDILFAFDGFVNWNYSGNPAANEVDIESVIFHELGHAHLLGHANDEEDVMYYAIAAGDVKREAVFNNILSSNYILDYSVNSFFCDKPSAIKTIDINCPDYNLTDLSILNSELNDFDSSCFGNYPVYFSLSNQGSDTATTANISWSLNGVLQNTMDLNIHIGQNQEQSNILLGNVDIQNYTNEIKIWINSSNGSTEVNTNNDLLSIYFSSIICVQNNASITYMEAIDNTNCPNPSDSLFVTLTNTGTNNLTSCKFAYSINDIIKDTVSWNGNLAPGFSASDLYLASESFYQGLYTIKTYIIESNNMIDQNHLDDTLTYSFTPIFCPRNDIGVFSISNFQNIYCPDTNYVEVCVKNFGIDTVYSFDVNTSLNGVFHGTYTWNGILAPNQTICNLRVDSLLLDHLTNTVLATSSNPNDTLDEVLTNDAGNKIFGALRLKGTYTIGGMNPDFTTIQAAINRAQQNGICGDVIFNIRDGFYSEQLNVNSVYTEDSTYTVTFQSESGIPENVYISNSNDINAPTLKVSNCNLLKFKNLTIASELAGSSGTVN